MKSVIALFLTAAMLATSACSFSSDLKKADEIISLLPAGFDLVPAIVCASDPSACAATSDAVKKADASVGALSAALSAWSAASDAAKPDAWSQVQAALTSLQQNASALLSAAQVKNPAVAAEIQAISGAVIAEVGEIAQIISQIRSSGSTVAAATSVMDQVAYSDDADLGFQCHGDCHAIWTPTVQLGVGRETHKTKAGMRVHTKKGFRNSLLKHLGKSGDTQLDKVNAVLRKRLKSL